MIEVIGLFDYSKSELHKTGEMFKEFGERLMDPRTDLRDLVAVADALGCEVRVSLEPRAEVEGECDAPCGACQQ